ncbi:MAG: 3-oxoacyl-ACP reductase FabG [Alphaproteobacteria bacterium]|nr:3-oxoacyl-ACP reductase FabG [Alphaproteobacteria bacterium]
MRGLKGKTALVTGASRGLGRAIALRLSVEGVQVGVAYRERRHEALSVVDEIEEHRGHAHAVALDATCRKSIADAAAEVSRVLGPISILVNNAGINKPTDFDAVTEKDWDDILNVNLKGPFLCAQVLLPHLRACGGGAIVHIGSVSGQYGGPRTAHYAASKAGLISLSQVIARFGAKDKIRSNVVAAGIIASDMGAAGLAAASVQKAAENILLKRLGLPHEVADAVAFLASDEAAYITGQTLNVNGGLYF